MTVCKKLLILNFIMMLLICSKAFSATLTFEGLQDQELVQNFYNGGTGNLGSSGTNYGISFSNDGVALIDNDSGGSGNFANEPSPNTVIFTQNSSFIMNVQNGFNQQLSFYYSSSSSVTISIYSGLDGTGNLLTSLTVPSQYQDNGCTGDPNGIFCNWTQVSMNFQGIAHSVVFADGNNKFAFDNIQLGLNQSAVSVPTLNVWGQLLLVLMIVFVVFLKNKDIKFIMTK